LTRFAGTPIKSTPPHRTIRSVEQLEEYRDVLLEAMAETVPDALDGLTAMERNKLYRMLCLEVTPTLEGY